jgi:hypothetical protein
VLVFGVAEEYVTGLRGKAAAGDDALATQLEGSIEEDEPVPVVPAKLLNNTAVLKYRYACRVMLGVLSVNHVVVHALLYVRACVHACVRTCVRAYMRACVHACVRAVADCSLSKCNLLQCLLSC